MTHYPPEKVRSDPKTPQDKPPTAPQTRNPEGGVQTETVTPGRTQGANYPT